MDLQEFSGEMLYFEDDISPEVEALINRAANQYGPSSERYLLKAYSIEPENLMVQIGLYRFYYYQNRFTDGLWAADEVLKTVAKKIEFPRDWSQISEEDVSVGIWHSFCMVRLYFFALKAAGYLNLRLSNFELGRSMIEKVVELDSADRMGARLLLDVLDQHKAAVVPLSTYR